MLWLGGGAEWRAHLQLGNANGNHTPHYDKPDQACRRDIRVQHVGILCAGVLGRVATHAQCDFVLCRAEEQKNNRKSVLLGN